MGDIGPKIGYNSKDNGYMSFSNLSIPRTNLVCNFNLINHSNNAIIQLRRYVDVDREGNFKAKGD